MKRVMVRRRGLGLIEVIVSVGIFVASMALIGQLLDVGLRLSEQDHGQTVALLRCESKMEEIVAGIVPLDESLPKEPIEDEEDPHWRWRVVTEPTNVEGLLRVVVVVTYFEDLEQTEEENPTVRESLTRLVVDPSLRQGPAGPTEKLEGRITVEEMLGLPEGTGR